MVELISSEGVWVLAERALVIEVSSLLCSFLWSAEEKIDE